MFPGVSRCVSPKIEFSRCFSRCKTNPRYFQVFQVEWPPCLICGNNLNRLLNWNLASISLSYRYYFGRCSSELAQLMPLPFSRGRSAHYSDRLHDFSVTIPRCYKDAYVSSFFPCIVRLWNSLPIECFPLTYNLNGFKPRINRHLLTIGSF